jgi:hypothetical protein
MSMIDQALGASTSTVNAAAQAEATKKARWAASPADWLSLALDHHDAIREAFEACRAAFGGPSRSAALKRLTVVQNGHSMAEELVLYPALAQSGEKLAAGRAYAEQTAAKLRMAELERVDPACDRWLEKLEHIREAALQHMYEEERGWFLDLKDKAEDQTYLAKRFQQEFERYVGEDRPAPTLAEPRSFDPARASTGALDRH